MNKTQRLKRRIAYRVQHPLVLHLRKRRFSYGDNKLGQAELAVLAGIAPRQLRKYEACTRLPRAVANLLAIAVALDVHLDDLVADTTLQAIRDTVAKRRQQLRRGRTKR